MVEFYAPWCSHCMRCVAHFKRAAVALDGLAEFGAVNCDKAHTLCSKLGIKSFPKFLLFSPRFEWSEEYPKDRLKELGKPKDAMGDDIVEWVRLMLPPKRLICVSRYSRSKTSRASRRGKVAKVPVRTT